MNMWTQNNDGSVSWSEEAKLKLVALLKRNPEALISTERQNPRKAVAWKKVYESLIKAGMPRTPIIRVKKCWSRMHRAAIAKHDEQIKKYKRHGKLTLLPKLNQAVIDMLNTNIIPNIMPKVSDSIIKSSFNIIKMIY